MTRRAIAVTTIGAGALFVVLGSLLPLYGVETTMRPGVNGPLPGGVRRLVAITGWEYVQEPPPPTEYLGSGLYPVYGYGLVLAAVVAAVGALLQLRSPLLAAVGRFGVLAAVGVVVGTVWAVLETMRTLFGSVDVAPIVTTEEFVGAGAWLLLLASVAMVAGAVLAHDWPPRTPRPAGVSVYQVDDDDTPPFGFPMPVSGSDVPPGGPAAPGPVPQSGPAAPGPVPQSGPSQPGPVSPGPVQPGPVAPPVAHLPPVVEFPGASPSPDDRRHPTGG
ncbi:hypothetical protein ACWEFJ_36280 [Actinosynnema sp. NPDC004786]